MSANQPLVTIIIPAFNHENFIKECLDSAEAQSFSNIELLIINDGSKDRTHQVIEEWLVNASDRWVRLEYINQENKGLTSTLNWALKWAKGKYISPIASDDVMCPGKIELLVEDLEQKGDSYAAAFGDAQFMDEKGKTLDLEIKDDTGNTLDSHQLFLNYYTFGRKIDLSNPDFFGSYSTLLSGNYLPAMSSLIRTEYIRNVGGWTSGNCVEDWELWLKLSKKHRFSLVKEVVALYRLHGSNATKVKREQILRDSIWLLENEKAHALEKKLHRFFFPAYQFNLGLLRKFDSKQSLMKRFHLFRDRHFYQYFLERIKNKLNG